MVFNQWYLMVLPSNQYYANNSNIQLSHIIFKPTSLITRSFYFKPTSLIKTHAHHIWSTRLLTLHTRTMQTFIVHFKFLPLLVFQITGTQYSDFCKKKLENFICLNRIHDCYARSIALEMKLCHKIQGVPELTDPFNLLIKRKL